MDTNTLIALAAPLVALIGSVATLFGVGLTMRNNRKLKEMELAHDREIRSIELENEVVRVLRQEKREAYLEAIKSHRIAVGHALHLAEMSVTEEDTVKLDKINESAERFEALLPELELVASPPVRELVHKLYAGIARCQDTMYEESKRAQRDE